MDEVAYEEYKEAMEYFRIRARIYDRDAARALHRAHILGKACNIIWQKNFEAATTRPNRTQREINDLANMYFTLRDQIQELKFKAEECDIYARRLYSKAYHEAVNRIRE